MPQDINNESLLFISSTHKMKNSSEIFQFLIAKGQISISRLKFSDIP